MQSAYIVQLLFFLFCLPFLNDVQGAEKSERQTIGMEITRDGNAFNDLVYSYKAITNFNSHTNNITHTFSTYCRGDYLASEVMINHDGRHQL